MARSTMTRRVNDPYARCTVRLAAFLLFSLPIPLAAQVVRGQVVDSVTQAPVSGGVVILLGEADAEVGRTVTDPEGLFLIRVPSAGQFRLRVQGEGYRESDFPAFDLGADQMRGFMLLVASLAPPPAASTADLDALIERACGEGGLPRGQPLILGVVRDEVTGEPIPKADVILTWSAVPEFMDQRVDGTLNAGGTAVTGSTGAYAVCGAPVATDVVMHAEVPGRMSRMASLRFEGGGVYVDGSFTEMTDPIWREDLDLFSGNQLTGVVRGSVLDTIGNRVPDVTINLIGTTLQARTNVVGDFRLTGLPPGTLRLSAERVGYRPTQTEIELEAGEAVELPLTSLRMAPAPLALDPIRVEAEGAVTRRNLVEFEKRRLTTNGSFMTRAEWEKLGAVDETVDVLRRLRGLRIRAGTNITQPWVITSTRSGGRSGTGQCYPLVFMDRLLLGTTNDLSVNRVIPMTALEAVEFYGNAAGLPAEFNRPGAVCGVLVFWSR